MSKRYIHFKQETIASLNSAKLNKKTVAEYILEQLKKYYNSAKFKNECLTYVKSRKFPEISDFKDKKFNEALESFESSVKEVSILISDFKSTLNKLIAIDCLSWWPNVNPQEIYNNSHYLHYDVKIFMEKYCKDGIKMVEYIFTKNEEFCRRHQDILDDLSNSLSKKIMLVLNNSFKITKKDLQSFEDMLHQELPRYTDFYKAQTKKCKDIFNKNADNIVEVITENTKPSTITDYNLLLHLLVDNFNDILTDGLADEFRDTYAITVINKLFANSAKPMDGKTSLQRAAEHLKKYDSDLTLYTPLHRAIQKGENVIAMQLVKLGGFGVTQLDNGVNILNHCITEKNIDLLQDIINNPRLDIKSFVMPTKKHPDFDEINTPLFQAVAEGKVKMLKKLIMCYRDTKDCYNNRHIIGYILNYGQSHKKEMIDLLVSPEITKSFGGKVLCDISAASELVRMFNSEEDEGIKEYLEKQQPQIIVRALISCMNGGIEYISMMKCLYATDIEIDDKIPEKHQAFVKILKKTTDKSVEKHPDFEIVNTPLLQAVINGETETIRKLINANKESCTNQLYYATDLDTGSHIFEYILHYGGSKKKEMIENLVSEINFCDLRVGYALVDMFNSNKNKEFGEFLTKDHNSVLRDAMIRFIQEGLVYISQIECLFRNGAKITDAIRKVYPEHVKILDSLNVETKAEPCEEINIEDQLSQASISQDLNVEPAGEESTANDVLAA